MVLDSDLIVKEMVMANVMMKCMEMIMVVAVVEQNMILLVNNVDMVSLIVVV